MIGLRGLELAQASFEIIDENVFQPELRFTLDTSGEELAEEIRKLLVRRCTR